MKQRQLFYALLKSKTKQAAAYSAGIAPRTMYRWLADDNFRAAYRVARRSLFDESLAGLERGAGAAAQALMPLPCSVQRRPNLGQIPRFLIALRWGWES